MTLVRYMDLPLGVRGFVTESEDGTYNVYINSRYCFSQNQRTLAHELKHIELNHLDSSESASVLETAI